MDPVFAIVVVERPPGHTAQIQGAWPAFESALPQFGLPGSGMRQLCAETWLFELPKTTGALAEIVHEAASKGLPHRVLYFSGAPSEYVSKGGRE